MMDNSQPGFKAVIREDECIGCTKCLEPCPTDAILGAAKVMHTVIADACTGCELCVPTCPVDCIEMVVSTPPSAEQQAKDLTRWQARQQQHNKRLARDKATADHTIPTLEARQAAILAAVARSKAKKARV